MVTLRGVKCAFHGIYGVVYEESHLQDMSRALYIFVLRCEHMSTIILLPGPPLRE